MIHTGYTEVWPRHWFTETKGCKCFLPADGSEESYKAVINGVITRRKWPSKWVTGVMTLLIMVITPFITGWGPPCIYFSKNNVTNYPAQLVSISNINLKSRITWLRNFQRRFAKSLKHFDQVFFTWELGAGLFFVFFRQVSRHVWNKKPPFQNTTRKS